MVEEIGPEHVVHIVTDNGSNYKKACKEQREVYEHIAWTPCLAHRQFDVDGYSSKARTCYYDQAVQANFKLVTQSWSVEYNDEERNQW